MIIRTRPTTPPPAPVGPVLRRPTTPELVVDIVARSGLGWRGQRPTTEPPRLSGPTAIVRLADSSGRRGASGVDHARRRTLTEAELFLGYGLDDVDVREKIG